MTKLHDEKGLYLRKKLLRTHILFENNWFSSQLYFIIQYLKMFFKLHKKSLQNGFYTHWILLTT